MTSSASNQRHPSFATTRWSTVTHVLRQDPRDRGDALDELGTRYHYPVYAYVRHCGHSPPIALDITCSFLVHLGRPSGERDKPSAKDHFRRYLLARLHAFLAEDWRWTRDDPVAALDLPAEDLEARYLRTSVRASTPEQAFQRAFALEVLGRSLERLHAEARQTGHDQMYVALAPFLARDPAPGEYDEIARLLRTRPLAMVVALKRLRQRLRELANEELADTVSSAEDLAAEQHALLAVLQGTG